MLKSGIEYIWIDSLCIDRNSTVDLDDAVNGANRRLRNSTVCIVYLHDLPSSVSLDDAAAWHRCRYWTRSWTLQELLLAPHVQFYDQGWNLRGTKDTPELATLLSAITSVPRSVLLDSNKLSEVALGARISWSARRVAENEEDTAYALVAITGATLPVRYGEGAERAFIRLQEELLRDTRDGSLLAWRSEKEDEVRGLLARSPSEFRHFAQPRPSASSATGREILRPWVFNGKVRFSNKGIELKSQVCNGAGCLLLSIGQRRKDMRTATNVAICVRKWKGVYVRVAAASKVAASVMRNWRTINVARDVDVMDSVSMRSLFSSMPWRIEVAAPGASNGAWRQNSLAPHVLQDHENVEEVLSSQGDEDQDTEMKLDGDDAVALALTPHKSYTASSPASDGSYVNISSLSSMGAWQEQDDMEQLRRQNLTNISLRITQAEDEESDMESLPSSGAESNNEEEWDSDNARDMYLYDRREREDDDVDTMAETDGASMTTDNENHNSNANITIPDAVREAVLNTAYERVRNWIPTVHYITPPRDRLPPQSRINTTSWFAHPEALTAMNNSSNDSGDEIDTAGGSDAKTKLVPVFRPDGYLHLACPFTAADPVRYGKCLATGDDLQTLSKVRQHIKRCHGRLPYCALCHRDFQYAGDRDEHMSQRICEPVGRAPADGDASRKGVAGEELRRLKRMEIRYRHESEVQRWYRMFRLLFPDLDPQKSTGPYLRDGTGLAVSLAHDFWTQYRKECVSTALAQMGHDLADLNDADTLSCLYRTSLQDLVNKVYQEHAAPAA